MDEENLQFHNSHEEQNREGRTQNENRQGFVQEAQPPLIFK